jgi:hypothetical protein
MSLFDRLLRRQRQSGAVTPQDNGDVPHPLPLGLRVHGRVRFDRMLYRVAPQAMTAQLPDGDQDIACYGHVDLGDGYAIHRFYLEDDAYLQVMTCGGHVESINAFVYHGTVNPPNKAAFQSFVSNNPHLGAHEIEYAEKRWQRVTSPDQGPKIPPMVFDEVLFRGIPPRRSDDLTHYSVVYGRPVPELDREELLVVAAEDSGPDQYLVSYAVGLDLTEADLDIT